MGSDSATKAAPALRLIERNRPSATCKGTAAWSLPDVSARGRTGSDSNVVGVHDKFSVGGLDMGTIIRRHPFGLPCEIEFVEIKPTAYQPKLGL